MAPQRRALLALRQPRRAARLAAVVLRDAGARRAGDRRRARGARALHPQEPRAHLLRLDGADPAVVRLAPALVGPPAAGLVLHLRRDDRPGRAAGALPVLRLGRARRATPTCSTPGSRRRSGRSRRSAGPRTRRAARLLSRPRALHGARHHQPLGRADDHAGHRVHAVAEPFQDVVIHPTVLAADGRRMSKSLGTGVDPLDLIAEHGADATRYGLLKMSSTQDVRFAEGTIEEGRGLCNKLWNAARLILLNVDPEADAGAHARRAGRRLGARPARRRHRRGDRRARRLRLRRRGQGALPLHLERRLRLVPRGRQGAPLRRRRRGPARGLGDAPVRAALDAAARASRAAARDRAHLGASSARRASWRARLAGRRARRRATRAPRRPSSRPSSSSSSCASCAPSTKLPPRAPLALRGLAAGSGRAAGARRWAGVERRAGRRRGGVARDRRAGRRRRVRHRAGTRRCRGSAAALRAGARQGRGRDRARRAQARPTSGSWSARPRTWSRRSATSWSASSARRPSCAQRLAALGA